MKNTLPILFLLMSIISFGQKKEKKPWLYSMIEYEDGTHVDQCEVSYSDWFAFLYDKYLGEDREQFEHLIPKIKKSESRILWEFFLRNWFMNEESGRLKIKNAIVRFEIWPTIDGTIETFNLKKYMEFPITGLRRDQIDEYLEWYKEIQSEIYLAGYDNYQISNIGLPDPELAQKLAKEARRGGEYSVGDSVNTKGCQLFNFYSKVPCEGSEDRFKLYGNTNGMVASNDFFPDDNGLYNILGNVAEMTSTPNLSYGGNHTQNASKILATPTENYNEPDTLVGFRVVIKLSKVQ